jgi:hypothetical protein
MVNGNGAYISVGGSCPKPTTSFKMATKLLILFFAGLSLSCGAIFEQEVPTKGRAAYQE